MLIGNTLGAMEEFENAVSYFRYSTTVVNAYAKLSGNAALTTQFLEANDYYAAGNYQAAFDTFTEIMGRIEAIYSFEEVEIEETMVLALFAAENQSTVRAILDANDLPEKMTIKRGLIIMVPTYCKLILNLTNQ